MTQETLSHLHLPPPLSDMATTDRIRWGLVVAAVFLWAACEVGGKQAANDNEINIAAIFSVAFSFFSFVLFFRYLSESFVSVPTSELGSVTQMCLMVCACLSSPFGRRSTFNFLLHLFRLIPPKRRRGRTEDVALVQARASSGGLG